MSCDSGMFMSGSYHLPVVLAELDKWLSGPGLDWLDRRPFSEQLVISPGGLCGLSPGSSVWPTVKKHVQARLLPQGVSVREDGVWMVGYAPADVTTLKVQSGWKKWKHRMFAGFLFCLSTDANNQYHMQFLSFFFLSVCELDSYTDVRMSICRKIQTSGLCR